MFRNVLPSILASCIALCWPALACAQDGPATRSLRSRNEEALRILRRPAATDAERQRRSEDVRRILADVFDYEEMSRRALGEHWEQRSPEQRQRFVTLLRQLIERNYEGNLERIVDMEVRYLGESAGSDGTIVRTEARSRSERRQPPVTMDFTARQVDGRWRVYDVVVDGSSSLVTTYRRQFHRIITQNGWDELIRRMEERLARGGTER